MCSAPDIRKSSLSSISVTKGHATDVSTPPETPSVDDTKEGEVPGIPLASTAPTPFYLNVALPDAAYDEPEPAVSIVSNSRRSNTFLLTPLEH